MNASFELNRQCQHALCLMTQTKQHLFITGKAGTGKSTLLSHFVAHSAKRPVVLAPTGVAALNVKGQTIHRFFNFYVDVTPEKIRAKEQRPRDTKLYKKLQTIIIDEISMVRADTLDCIDVFLRMYGPEKQTPFGGVQMVFIGDLYQLPPVVSRAEQEIFATHYATPYFFSAHCLQDAALEIIELEKIYRQKDETFINLLGRIRTNTVTQDDITLLNSRQNTTSPESSEDMRISLTTTNANADAINQQHLDALKGDAIYAEAEISGSFTKDAYPTSTELELKVGAQVMLLSNDNKQRWVNGSVGVVEDERADAEGEHYLRVRLQETNKIARVYQHQWEMFKFALKDDAIISEPAGTFKQYPIRLAWAVTIHKSQGKTFDYVTLDIGERGSFTPGQIYVGLSRCTSFEGITLATPISRRDIRTDQRVTRFFAEYYTHKMDTSPSYEEKIAVIAQAIKNKASLSVLYVTHNGTATLRGVMPHSLEEATYRTIQYTGMRATCEDSQRNLMFRLDNVIDITLLPRSTELKECAS